MSLIVGDHLREFVNNSIHQTVDKLPIDIEYDGILTHMSDEIFVESTPPIIEGSIRTDALIDLSYVKDTQAVTNMHSTVIHNTQGCFRLKPQEFIITKITEYIELPNDIYGMFTIRSKYARNGLEQSASLMLKPNWEGNLILELRNVLRYHDIHISRYAPIGQIQFFKVYDAKGA